MQAVQEERLLKTAWHLLLVGVAIAEMNTAKTPLRKMLLGACAGWHAAAVWIDWTDLDVT